MAMMEVFTCGKNYKLIQMQSNVLLVCDEQIKQVEHYNFMQSLSHGSVLHISLPFTDCMEFIL